MGRLELSRLARSGHLQRLEHAVYRDAGAPGDALEPLRAAWLSTEPGRLAEDRLGDRENGIVIAGRSAAIVHGIGDFGERFHEFSTPVRRQTKRPDIHYRKRTLRRDAVVVREGLPVTSPEQTVIDLLDDGEDLSLVSQVVRDASREQLDRQAVLDGITARAVRRYEADAGSALWEKLLREARIDDQTIAAEVAAGPIGRIVVSTYLRELRHARPEEG